MKPSMTVWAIALLLGASSVALPALAELPRSAPLQLAQSSTPEKTYMTVRNGDAIAIQITDGEFFFADTLHRAYGNNFTATSSGVQVSYDLDTGNVLVVNSATGTEFYNYYFSPPASSSSGNRPSGGGNSSASSATPRTSLSPMTSNEIAVYITDGEFSFDGTLVRTSGNAYVGEDGRVRVMYDKDTGRIVIINVVTGDEFYNYTYSGGGEGAL